MRGAMFLALLAMFMLAPIIHALAASDSDAPVRRRQVSTAGVEEDCYYYDYDADFCVPLGNDDTIFCRDTVTERGKTIKRKINRRLNRSTATLYGWCSNLDGSNKSSGQTVVCEDDTIAPRAVLLSRREMLVSCRDELEQVITHWKGKIAPYDEVDQFTFRVSRESVATIHVGTFGFGERPDPYVELRTRSGDLVEEDDDSGGGPEGVDARIRDIVLKPGSYRILVGDCCANGGRYYVTLRLPAD